MTVRILSGGAAALTVPEKINNDNEAHEKAALPSENVSEKPIVVSAPETAAPPYYEPRNRARPHVTRKGSMSPVTVFMLELAVCGLLFAAAWAALCFAPEEAAGLVLGVIGRFTGK